MITKAGALCDVCGHYILPLDPDERVNFFKVKQLVSTSDLCCHNKCKDDMLACGKDWEKLPVGPLRKVYEDALAHK